MAEKTTLARPYAEAIFDLASEDKSFNNWTKTLSTICDITSNDEVQALIGNPEIDTKDSISIITEISQGKLNEQAINLLHMAGENDRLDIFNEIAEELEKLIALDKGTLDAEVISAFAVNAAQEKLILESLKKRFNKEVTITTRVDKSLLGGIVIHVGDLVIDGSVSNQLQKITQTLMR